MLLNPEDHGLPLASSVSALQYAADENNPAAVEFLADVLLDEDKRPLWLLASDGLHEAARKGNAVARHALEAYEKSELARKTLSAKALGPAERPLK